MYESHKVFLPSPSCGPTFLRSVQYAIITQSLSGFSTDGGIVCSLKASFLCWWASRSFLRFLWHAADNWSTTVNRTRPLSTIPSINLAKSLETRRDERPFKGIKRLPKIFTVRLWATQTSPSTPGERGAGWLFQPRLNVLPLSFLWQTLLAVWVLQAESYSL